jgi:LysM repeat protein
MKPTAIQSADNGEKPLSLRSERVNQLLVLAAFILLAALAALVADLWIWPISEGPVAQAISPAALPPSPSPTAPLLAVALPPATAVITPTAILTVPLTPPPCVPPDDWGIHVVQEGNTLFSLAQRYGTDVDTLMRVNCLNTFTIFAEQRLYVPGPAATPTPIVPLSTPPAAPPDTPRPGASATPMAGDIAAPTAVPTVMSGSRFRVNIPNRYLNIVLLGSDKRPASGAWRTDSMIVVSVDMEQNIVRLLSIPRDLWVYIPGHGYNRINTADLWG